MRFEELAAGDRWAFAIGPFGSRVTTGDYRESGVPFVRGVNLARGPFLDDDFVYIDEGKAREIGFAAVTAGDLVFTRKGTIGQVSMIPRAPRFVRYVISGSQMKARLDETRACPEFYYYWFRSPVGRQRLLANAGAVGVPSLPNSLATLRDLRVPLPPLPVQRAIAEVLGTLDGKIAVNERIAATYERMLRLEFAALGIDVPPAPGAAVPASALVDFNPRRRLPRTPDAAYVGMADLPTATARVTAWTRRPPKPGTRFTNGDTVMARITPCLENGKTAYIDFLDADEVGAGSTEFIVMRARPPYPPQLSYFLARSPRFRGHAVRSMAGSSGRQRVAAAALAGFPLARPDAGRLAAFGAAASAAFAHVKALDAESGALAELRDALLPKLTSGAIPVRAAAPAVTGDRRDVTHVTSPPAAPA
ncbi:MAG TPA: restriction endonuclease subunit S [Streptosporangiaceae bacterium]